MEVWNYDSSNESAQAKVGSSHQLQLHDAIAQRNILCFLSDPTCTKSHNVPMPFTLDPVYSDTCLVSPSSSCQALYVM